jgi:hypothetical protein
MVDERRAFLDDAVKIGFALSLEGAEFRHVLFRAPRHARFVESEELEVAALGDPSAALRHGDPNFLIAGSDFVGLRDGICKHSRLKPCGSF